jgi:signal peptidase II
MLGLVACDQTSKALAVHALAGGKVIPVVPGLFDLRLAHNTGAAFSMMAGLSVVAMAIVQLAIVGVASAFWWRMRGQGARAHVAFGVLIAGALANVVDRIARGAVVDFMHLRHWPIFNVADIAIVVGAIGLALAARRPFARGG